MILMYVVLYTVDRCGVGRSVPAMKVDEVVELSGRVVLGRSVGNEEVECEDVDDIELVSVVVVVVVVVIEYAPLELGDVLCLGLQVSLQTLSRG